MVIFVSAAPWFSHLQLWVLTFIIVADLSACSFLPILLIFKTSHTHTHKHTHSWSESESEIERENISVVIYGENEADVVNAESI